MNTNSFYHWCLYSSLTTVFCLLISCATSDIVPSSSKTNATLPKRAFLTDTAQFRAIADTIHLPTQSIYHFARYICSVFPHLRHINADWSARVISTAREGRDSFLSVPLYVLGVDDRSITLEVRKIDSFISYLAIKQLVRHASSEFIYVTDIAGVPLLSTELEYTIDGYVHRKLVTPVVSWAVLPEKKSIDQALLSLMYAERPLTASSFEERQHEVGGEALNFILKYPPIDINTDGYIDEEEFVSALAYDASKIVHRIPKRPQLTWQSNPPNFEGYAMPTIIAHPKGMYIDVVAVTFFKETMHVYLNEVVVSAGASSGMKFDYTDLSAVSSFMNKELPENHVPYPGQVDDIVVYNKYQEMTVTYKMPTRVGCPQSIFGANVVSGSVALTSNINKLYGGKGKLRPRVAPTSTGQRIAPQASGITFLSLKNPLRLNYHDGVDYVAEIGTALYPIYDGGEVIGIDHPYVYTKAPPNEKDNTPGREEQRGYGNNMLIRYRLGDDYVIVRYAHLYKIPDHIKVGSKVNKGDVVTYSGRSGIIDVNATPHVHVDVFRVAVADYGPGKKIYFNAQTRLQEGRPPSGGGKAYRTNGVLQDPFEYNPVKYTGTRIDKDEPYMFPMYNDGLIQPAFVAKCK